MILTPQSIFVRFTKYIEQYLHDIFATNSEHHTVPYKEEPFPKLQTSLKEYDEDVEDYDCSRTS